MTHHRRGEFPVDRDLDGRAAAILHRNMVAGSGVDPWLLERATDALAGVDGDVNEARRQLGGTRVNDRHDETICVSDAYRDDEVNAALDAARRLRGARLGRGRRR